jgi:hypothetical protein
MKVVIPAFEEGEADYLTPIEAQLTAEESKKFRDAYEHPSKPPRSVKQKIQSTRASFARSPALFESLPGLSANTSFLQQARPLGRSFERAAIRHRTLSKTEPRHIFLGAHVTNYPLLLQHQRIANALQSALGPARLRDLLKSAEGPRPGHLDNAWNMGWWPDGCVQGYVWRDAFPEDHVCVTPAVRAQAAEDNRLAASRRLPHGGPYGPDSCQPGFVWRGAGPNDHVCVSASTRNQAYEDNRLAASRRTKP